MRFNFSSFTTEDEIKRASRPPRPSRATQADSRRVARRAAAGPRGRRIAALFRAQSNRGRHDSCDCAMAPSDAQGGREAKGKRTERNLP